MFDLIEIPEPFSVWQHTNGLTYTVISVTNTNYPREDHPADVFYISGVIDPGDSIRRLVLRSLWTRRLDDWHRSMTKLK